MKRFGKHKPAVIWLHARNSTISYALKEACILAIVTFAAICMTLFSVVHMLTDHWPQMTPGIKGFGVILIPLSVLTLLYEIVLPKLESFFRRMGRLMFRLSAVALVFWGTEAYALRFYNRDPLPIEDGFLQVGAWYLDVFNKYYKTNYYLDVGREDCVALSLTFLLVLLVIVLWSLSYLFKKRGFWLLLPIVVWLAELIVGLAPLWGSQVLLCVAVYLFSASGNPVGVIGKRVSISRRQRSTQRKMNAVQSAAALLLLLFCVSSVSLIGQQPANYMMTKSPKVKTWQLSMEDRVKEGISTSRLTNLFDGSANVSNRKPVFSDKKIVTISTGDRLYSNLYLKNFQAGEYKRGIWRNTDAAFEKACIEQGFDLDLVQRLIEGGSAKDLSKTVYTLEYHSAVQEALLAPYFVDVDALAGEESKVKKKSGDVLLKKDVSDRKLEIAAAKNNEFNVYDVSTLYRSSYYPLEEEIWDWYGAYVLEHYLEVPDSVPSAAVIAKQAQKKMDALVGKVQDKKVSRIMAAYLVADILSEYSYSWDLDELSAGEDAVEYFLSTGHQGYCMHFASAGVLALREMGVPARYAAGYVVKRETISYQKADVLDRDAHAWAEVYIDRAGWIPIEMTTGFLLPENELPDEPAEEDEPDISTESESLEESEGSEETEISEESQISEAENNSEDMTETENTPDPGGSQAPGEENESEHAQDSADASDPSSSSGEQGSLSGGDDIASSADTPQIDEEEQKKLAMLAAIAKNQRPKLSKKDAGTGDGSGAGEGGENGEGADGDFYVSSVSEYVQYYLLLWGMRLEELKERLIKVLAYVLPAILFAAALALLLRARIRAYYRILVRDMQRKRYRRVIQRINRRIFAGLRRTGRLGLRYPKDPKYAELLKKNYPKIEPGDWDRYMEIVKEAAYSRNVMKAEDADFCYKIYEKVKLF